ncbi:hypothetical protein [Pseudoalteromonas luteoviolacea]|nr:hypothetical protein [Pseudoalteromonas luteoviolacea]
MFGKRKVSSVILACVPLIDLLLLMFVIYDLLNGSYATFAHGLATAYIGFTIAFGPLLVGCVDKWFSYKFSQGPSPVPTALTGWQAVLDELKLWFRCILAVLIIYVLLILIVVLVDDPAKTHAITIWFKIPVFTVLFWFIFGPVWSMVFFKRSSN